jgi:hypothetical protein
MNLVQGAAVALATLGLMLPAPQVMAASSSKPVIETVNASMFDIGLQHGVFAGRVVDHTGTAAKSAEVVVRQGEKVIAKTTTDETGRFEVKGLRGGVYEVASGKTIGTYRVWQQEVAPPAAKEQALLVLGENGTRGQFGGLRAGSIFIAATLVTATVLSIIAIDRANDANDKIDNLSP